MFKLIRITLIKSLLFLTVIATSQNKEQLKSRKEALKKEIAYTNKLLEKTKKNKTKSLTYVNILEAQIKNEEEYVSTITLEITYLKGRIRKTENKINEIKKTIFSQEKEIEVLLKNYADMIYFTNRNKLHHNPILFIISSKDFNQAYKRSLYFKQYTHSRKNQIRKIKEAKAKLEKHKIELIKQTGLIDKEQEEKKIAASQKKKEIENLSVKRKEKETIVSKLQKSQELFEKKIKENQRLSKELDEKIRKIIEEEIRKARESAEKTKSLNLTPKAKIISNNFQNNKGGLPWPLDKGVIVQEYGKQTHKQFGNVQTFNNGIDIATEKNSAVRSVFDGTVSRIFYIKGKGKAVLINHGEYFTVYSGLKEIFVKTGAEVLTSEKIGIVSNIDEEDRSELHFEIWHGYDKQNPALWLTQDY